MSAAAGVVILAAVLMFGFAYEKDPAILAQAGLAALALAAAALAGVWWMKRKRII